MQSAHGNPSTGDTSRAAVPARRQSVQNRACSGLPSGPVFSNLSREPAVLKTGFSVPPKTGKGESVPYLLIQTNREPDADAAAALRQAASRQVAEDLGKPEGYVMVALMPGVDMQFGGSTEPLAYLELKSIGLPRERTKALSASLCDLAGSHLDVPPERIYIEFADAERGMWGTNRTTFER